MKHTTNATGEVAVIEGNKPLTEAIPILDIPARVLAGEWPVSIASELIGAWAAPHGWHNIDTLVSLYRWRVAALWLQTLPDNCNGRALAHAGQEWVITPDMVRIILMEGVESTVHAQVGTGKQASETIAGIYMRSVETVGNAIALTNDMQTTITRLFEMATDHLAQQGHKKPAAH